MKTTTLSSHLRSLNSNNIQHDINWGAKEHTAPFNPATGWCKLCTLERHHILFDRDNASLNQRSEFFCHCYHKQRTLLVNRWKWSSLSGTSTFFSLVVINVICAVTQCLIFPHFYLSSEEWHVQKVTKLSSKECFGVKYHMCWFDNLYKYISQRINAESNLHWLKFIKLCTAYFVGPIFLILQNIL